MPAISSLTGIMTHKNKMLVKFAVKILKFRKTIKQCSIHLAHICHQHTTYIYTAFSRWFSFTRLCNNAASVYIVFSFTVLRKSTSSITRCWNHYTRPVTHLAKFSTNCDCNFLIQKLYIRHAVLYKKCSCEFYGTICAVFSSFS